MYLLFREKNWIPSQYFFLSPNEKRIVRIFLTQEIAERKEAMDRIRKEGEK